MAIQVTKKEGESAASLLRRFSKTVQQSGITVRARELRFYKKAKNKRAVKKSALRREEMREKYARLRKLGLEEKK